MRLLLVDPDPARAALVAEGLADMAPFDLRRAARLNETELRAFAPDLVVIACDSPDRDTLESLREASQQNPKPVVMFVDRSEPGLGEEAVRASPRTSSAVCRPTACARGDARASARNSARARGVTG